MCPPRRIGTHTLGGVEGLVGGYQLVHWKRPPGELVYSGRNEEKDTLIASGSSVDTPRSRSNLLHPQQVMQGMIGMMQVLAGRAHTIYEVYPWWGQLANALIIDRPQVEQSNAEVLSWRILHAGTWEEQTLPPLAIEFNLRRKIEGQDRVAFLQLRLVLVKASKIPSARSHILEHIVQRAHDTWHKLTLPNQRTLEMMLWGYAIDKQHRVMAWLGPAHRRSLLPQ